MIPQHTVEAALDSLDDEAAVEGAMLAFATAQTPFLQYLASEGFELLTAEERDYLQYLALVIHEAARLTYATVPELGGALVEEWDERAWAWMQATVGQPMDRRLDRFFAEVDQEELLAFAEDSLVDEGDRDGDNDPDGEGNSDGGGDAPALFASGASRELGFVALATLIGGLDHLCGEIRPTGGAPRR